MNFDPSVSSSSIGGLTAEQQERLTQLLDKYLKQLEAGIPPDADRIATENPDLAEVFLAYIQQIESLHNVAAGFASSHEPPETETAASDEEQRLGDFVLLREVGRGGMGVVYEGRQISLGRRVAIKVLPFAAVLDGKQISRFKNEAQAAAQVLHPNIVPVFAIGVDRGVHFYAMQFIDGQPLDRAIAELRGRSSSNEDRLPQDSPTLEADATLAWNPAKSEPPQIAQTPTLDAARDGTANSSFFARQSKSDFDYFRTVAELGIQAAGAAHAAHEYGVVHRDIKPSNLLVDQHGKLWVTDFGLARCQTEGTLTKTGDVLGTLRYMSPEQAAGNTAYVDHRTDIYSLGATLYEMLTLRPAFPGDTNAQLLKQIETEEPTRPRQLRPSIPADLETVVLKAMSKVRDERYATAQDLADDLRCFLDGRPTVARPPSPLDRLARWGRRHYRLVSLAAAIGLVLTIVFGISTALVMRAQIKTEAETKRAQENLRETRKAVEYFAIRVPELLKDVPGAARAHHSFLQECSHYYRMFLEQDAADPTLQAETARWHSKLGTLEDRIGQRDKALAEHQQALELFLKLHAEDPGNLEHQRSIGLCQNNLGQILSESHKVEAAQDAFREALAWQTNLVDDSKKPVYRADLARTQNNYALFLASIDQPDAAQQAFRESIQTQRQLVEADSQDVEKLQHLATYYQNLSRLLATSQPEQAMPYCEDAVRAYQSLVKSFPTSAEYQSSLALAYHSRGVIQTRLGRTPQARDSYQAAARILDKLHRAAPYVKSYGADLALTMNDLGQVYHQTAQPDKSQEAFARALALQHELIKLDPTDPNAAHTLGGIYNNLGLVLEKSQQFDAAARAFQHAVESQQNARKSAPDVERFRLFLSKHYYNLGRVLRTLNRPQQAVQTAEQRRQLWQDQSDQLLSIAEELALSAELMQGDEQATVEDRAIELLVAAVEAGADALTLPNSLKRLYNHPRFTNLFKMKGFHDSDVKSDSDTQPLPSAGV